MILPRKAWETRLCLILGITLVILDCIEIPRYGIMSFICSHNNQGCFGDLDVIGKIFLFLVPFIVAKIIEFIVVGFKKDYKQTEIEEHVELSVIAQQEKSAQKLPVPSLWFVFLFIIIMVVILFFLIEK